MVTGGSGFVGSHLVEQLVAKNAKVTVVDCSAEEKCLNLSAVRDQISFVRTDLSELDQAVKAFRGQDILLHLAAKVAGVAVNQARPASMLYGNSVLNLSALEAARLAGIQKVELVSTACVYPRDCTIPTPESEGFKDDPDPSNLGYGWSKRFAEVQARLYVLEYGMEIGVVRPYNTYGPRDHFDLKTSHVIPALIRRVLEGEDPVVVWGDGTASRSFLYVEDFARGVLEATERYRQPDPVNLGTTEEITIQSLVELIVRLSDRKPKITFDSSKPSGQPRRNCDVAKAKEKVGFEAKVSLEEGIQKTIAWCQQHKERVLEKS